jgi:hypothetical protein
VVTTLVWFVFYPTRGCGCIVRPAFPTPSFFGAEDFTASLGRKLRRGNAGVCLSTSLRGALATKQSILSLRGEMDCFACARNDGVTNAPQLNCHRPRKRAIQYSEEMMIEPRSRSVLDTPPSRGMTTMRMLRGGSVYEVHPNATSTLPSPSSSITTLSPASSHTVLTRLPVSTISPARRPLPPAARWLASQASGLCG